jgi:hypothetical protein
MPRWARRLRRASSAATICFAADDEKERKVSVLLLGNGVLSTHRFERPLAVEMDEHQDSAAPLERWKAAALLRRTSTSGRCRELPRPRLRTGTIGGPAGVHGFDDLGVADLLKVDRGDPEVRLTELALYDAQRHPLAGHLHGVSMAQLVRRGATPTPASRRGSERAAVATTAGRRSGR